MAIRRSKLAVGLALVGSFGLTCGVTPVPAQADDCTVPGSCNPLSEQHPSASQETTAVQGRGFATWNDHKQIRGVGDYGRSTKRYWSHSNASDFRWDMDQAMRDWVKTTEEVGVTTPISYKRTNRKKSSLMDY